MARVFLSHSSQDRSFVEALAIRLNKAGLDVWYDRWEIRVGDSIVERIEEGISRSDFLIVVLSKHSVASPWVRKELDAATAREIQRRGAFILPVLSETCEIPPLLSGKRYANFETAPEQAFEELVEAVVSRSSSSGDTDKTQEQPSARTSVETVQLYTSGTGNDFTMYEGEEERGLDHITSRSAEQLSLLCALLVNEMNIEADQFKREKSLSFQKIGYPTGSFSASIARTQDDFQQWECEVVARYSAKATRVPRESSSLRLCVWMALNGEGYVTLLTRHSMTARLSNSAKNKDSESSATCLGHCQCSI